LAQEEKTIVDKIRQITPSHFHNHDLMHYSIVFLSLQFHLTCVIFFARMNPVKPIKLAFRGQSSKDLKEKVVSFKKRAATLSTGPKRAKKARMVSPSPATKDIDSTASLATAEALIIADPRPVSPPPPLKANTPSTPSRSALPAGGKKKVPQTEEGETGEGRQRTESM
jgi:hypothetical protein